jgi:DNA-binding GntR family transcriptional regulator
MAKRAYLSLVQQNAGSSAPNSRTLIERAYLRMREDIVEGRLAPGDKLRVEHLKAHYDVGAGTLREAITRLASDALVLAEGQRGFRVAPVTMDDLNDLTELRVHIEIEALRQSIRHGDAIWQANLERAFAAISAIEHPIPTAQRAQWEVLNSQFHDALIAGRTSQWTTNTLRLLSRHGERYRRYAMRVSKLARDVRIEHQAIFDFAVARQEARAALALEAHIRNTPDTLQRAHRDGIDVFRQADDAPTPAAVLGVVGAYVDRAAPAP